MGGESSQVLKVKGIALFSGGLDSILAVKVIQQQGIDVMGVTYETPFFSSRNAKIAAEKISLPLSTMDITGVYLEMLKAPRYGYGKNMNPCIDCHTMMLTFTGKIMEESGADFIFTGEVLGQRPMSQNRQSLHIVAKNSGYHEYILRPLSARLLPETKPEIEGKVDRQQLLALRGKGRKGQIELARYYGISSYTAPAGGCLLTDPGFSKRLRDLFTHAKNFSIRDIELLKYGRHFRIDENTKIIVGRNSTDNRALMNLAHDKDSVIHIPQIPGPITLIPNSCDDSTLDYGASLCALYSDAPKDREVDAICRTGNTIRHIRIKPFRKEDAENRML
ncbi:MAG: DUF814 domain-containing protein [Deltaproteobacteria bacterium]|nr:DUF814 domain-containing protein [Deltaproteobacteria bacterium]